MKDLFDGIDDLRDLSDDLFGDRSDKKGLLEHHFGDMKH